jgi:hypothetical protein
MKTFSAMSVPDKLLTRKSYLMNVVFINQLLASDNTLPEEKVNRMNKELFRLQTLIDAIDADMLTE